MLLAETINKTDKESTTSTRNMEIETDSARNIVEVVKNKKYTEEKKVYRYRDKEKDKLMYQKAKEHLGTYTKHSNLRKLHHRYNTNKNESLNLTISRGVPKDSRFARNDIWPGRVYFCVSVNSEGEEAYFLELYKQLGLDALDTDREFWRYRDNKNKYSKEYAGRLEVMHKRSLEKHRKIWEETEKELRDKEEGKTYSSNMGAPTPRHKRVCPLCGIKGHVTDRAKAC